MSQAGPELIVALCTAPNQDVAVRLSKMAVEKRLAACVTLVPGVSSLFEWEGKIQAEDEILLLLKTRADLFEPLREALAAAHPYQVPEVIALPASACHAPYQEWVGQVTRKKP